MAITGSAEWTAKVAAALNQAAAGDAGPLVGTSMALYTNQIVPQPSTTWDDLTEADFDGYAQVALTWDSQLDEADGSAKLLSNLANFRATDGTVPNTLYGYAVTDGGTPPKLLFMEPFDTPVNVSGANNGVSVVGVVEYAAADLGSATVIV